MRKATGFALLLLTCVWGPASAQGGLNLFWDACGAAEGKVQALFACDANEPTASLYVSVFPEASMTQFAAAAVTIEFYFAGGEVPPWWQTAAGQCRSYAIRPTFNPDDIPDNDECTSIWQGLTPVSVFTVQPTPGAPWAFRFQAVAAVPAGSELAVVADGRQRTVACVRVLRTKTVGDGACVGCRVGACAFLTQIELLSPTEPKQVIYSVRDNVDVGHNAIAFPGSWPPYCVTPAVRRTWGAIKSVHR